MPLDIRGAELIFMECSLGSLRERILRSHVSWIRLLSRRHNVCMCVDNDLEDICKERLRDVHAESGTPASDSSDEAFYSSPYPVRLLFRITRDDCEFIRLQVLYGVGF